MASGSLWWGWGLVCSWYLGVGSPACSPAAWHLGSGSWETIRQPCRFGELLGLGSASSWPSCSAVGLAGGWQRGLWHVENGRVWAAGTIQHPVPSCCQPLWAKGFPAPLSEVPLGFRLPIGGN